MPMAPLIASQVNKIWTKYQRKNHKTIFSSIRKELKKNWLQGKPGMNAFTKELPGCSSWRAIAIFFIVLTIAMASTLAFVIGTHHHWSYCYVWYSLIMDHTSSSLLSWRWWWWSEAEYFSINTGDSKRDWNSKGLRCCWHKSWPSDWYQGNDAPRPRTTILTPKTPVCGLLHGD